MSNFTRKKLPSIAEKTVTILSGNITRHNKETFWGKI